MADRISSAAKISIKADFDMGLEGNLPGVSIDDAEKIRDYLLSKIHKNKTDGI